MVAIQMMQVALALMREQEMILNYYCINLQRRKRRREAVESLIEACVEYEAAQKRSRKRRSPNKLRRSALYWDMRRSWRNLVETEENRMFIKHFRLDKPNFYAIFDEIKGKTQALCKILRKSLLHTTNNTISFQLKPMMIRAATDSLSPPSPVYLHKTRHPS